MEINGFNNKNRFNQPLPKQNLANNSGMGKDSPVLDIVAKRFNWGAFFLSWIWGLGNRSYITLIIFPIAILGMIPILGIILQLGCMIWFGINGNKWAWQNKKWASVEAFHKVQKKWAIAACVIEATFLILVTVIIATMTFPTLLSNSHSLSAETMVKKDISSAMQATMMFEPLEKKCKLTSEGLASCFAEEINVLSQTGNEFKTTYGSTWAFEANGVCKEEGDCQVEIDNGSENKITLPIYVKDNGYVEIRAEDAEQYLEQYLK